MKSEDVVMILLEMLKTKEKKPQGDDVVLVLHKGKMNNLSWQGDVKTCYYYGKLDHIARFCYKTKNNHQDNANNTKNNEEFIFATQYATHSKGMCKWIMNLGISNHITSCREALDTYEVVALCIVYMGDDSVM